jgi:phospholipid/cholesterol/gamma-HCH transport system permease protein
VKILATLGDVALFSFALIRAITMHGVSGAAVMEEAYRIGIKSLTILIVLNFFIGSNLAIQGYNAFLPLGGQRLVGLFVALAGVRELAPIIAASMVAAKAGTEMASQLGVMRITQQLDALEVMAISPLAHVVAPRLLGILLVMPALVLIAIATTLASGYLTSVYQLGLSGQTFLELAGQGIHGMDAVYAIIKAWVFGLLICVLSCYNGFNCPSGPEGVGKATNRAVVSSAVAVVIANYFLSELLYGGSGL